MKRRLKEPFGKAGLTVAVLALVMALVGGAYAAGGLTKSQEKQVTKIAKKYAGKPGANGANGTNGTNGKDGTNGTNGSPGTNGKSVTLAAATGCGEPGGTKLTVGAESEEVCNGQTGFTETLPAGKTEEGSWAMSVQPHTGPFPFTFANAAISFVIPLAVAPEAHYIKPNGMELIEKAPSGSEEVEEVTPTECGSGIGPGVNAENPQAAPGNLCVYAATEIALPELLKLASHPFGAVLSGAIGATGGTGTGSWAVTAQE
jgi:hypothetical protein